MQDACRSFFESIGGASDYFMLPFDCYLHTYGRFDVGKRSFRGLVGAEDWFSQLFRVAD